MMYSPTTRLLTVLEILQSKPTVSGPELAKKLVAAHCELTKWIQEHPTEAKVLLQAELSELLKATPKQELIDRALGCIVLTNEVNRLSMDKMVSSAQKAGFLQEIPDLGQLFPAL